MVGGSGSSEYLTTGFGPTFDVIAFHHVHLNNDIDILYHLIINLEVDFKQKAV